MQSAQERDPPFAGTGCSPQKSNGRRRPHRPSRHLVLASGGDVGYPLPKLPKLGVDGSGGAGGGTMAAGAGFGAAFFLAFFLAAFLAGAAFLAFLAFLADFFFAATTFLVFLLFAFLTDFLAAFFAAFLRFFAMIDLRSVYEQIRVSRPPLDRTALTQIVQVTAFARRIGPASARLYSAPREPPINRCSLRPG